MIVATRVRCAMHLVPTDDAYSSTRPFLQIHVLVSVHTAPIGVAAIPRALPLHRKR